MGHDKLTGLCVSMVLAMVNPAHAASVTVDIHKISSAGLQDKIGSVLLSDSEQGLILDVNISNLPAGERGFHIHENGDCGPGEKDGTMTAGLAAGAHYDPQNTKTHQGPDGSGHKGDLPRLNIAKGQTKLTAPRITVSEVRGRSIVVHEGGDTYSDNPELGGGKARIACGVISKP